MLLHHDSLTAGIQWGGSWRSTLTDRRIAAACALISPVPMPSSAVQPPPDHHYLQVSAVQCAIDSGSADDLSPALRLAPQLKTTQELVDVPLKTALIASALGNCGTAGGDRWAEGLPRRRIQVSRLGRSGPSTRDGAAQPLPAERASSRCVTRQLHSLVVLFRLHMSCLPPSSPLPPLPSPSLRQQDPRY